MTQLTKYDSLIDVNYFLMHDDFWHSRQLLGEFYVGPSFEVTRQEHAVVSACMQLERLLKYKSDELTYYTRKCML
jgi:hypothetical protein